MGVSPDCRAAVSLAVVPSFGNLIERVFLGRLQLVLSNLFGLRRVDATGTLARRYGVIDLVNAFSCIPDKKFRLKVCGVGDGLANILAATKIDRRIEYMGQLPRDEVLRLQESADLLINPRTSDGEYTRYSFPSKVMEYFASGTPTVMHRLPGIPDDYFKHCIVPPTEDAEGLTQAILIASSLGHAELRRIGLGARDFILSEKSAVQQCQKIVQLIDRC